jgi:hypothetical protein
MPACDPKMSDDARGLWDAAVPAAGTLNYSSHERIFQKFLELLEHAQRACARCSQGTHAVRATRLSE